MRKALRGELALPIVRIETNQKAQRGVHLTDLVNYIDQRRNAALKECAQLTGRQPYDNGPQSRYCQLAPSPLAVRRMRQSHHQL